MIFSFRVNSSAFSVSRTLLPTQTVYVPCSRIKALSKILPAYTGAENLADIMEQSDPEEISYNLAVTDTDSLVVIVKALGYYIGEGIDENILGALQREAVSVLKTRF